MKKLIIIFAVLISFFSIWSAKAASITTLYFDDGSFPDPLNSSVAGYNYAGFYWLNFEEAKDGTNPDYPSNSEAYSKYYALKNINDSLKIASISILDPGGSFYFESLYIRSITKNDHNVIIRGMLDGNEVYSYGNSLSMDYEPLINTNHNTVLIDSLVFDWQHDQGGINIDNFAYSPVPEPASIVYLTTGLLGFLIRRKNVNPNNS